MFLFLVSFRFRFFNDYINNRFVITSPAWITLVFIPARLEDTSFLQGREKCSDTSGFPAIPFDSDTNWRWHRPPELRAQTRKMASTSGKSWVFPHSCLSTYKSGVPPTHPFLVYWYLNQPGSSLLQVVPSFCQGFVVSA